MLSNRVFLLLAVLIAMFCVVTTIPYLALSDEYATLRDGQRVVGTVARVEPHRSYVTIEIAYQQGGKPARTTAYPKTAEAAKLPVGARVDLLVSGKGAIRASSLDSKRPPAALLVGAIATFALAVLCVVLDRKLRVGDPRPNEPLDVVTVGITRTRNVRLAGLILFVLFGVGIALVPLADDGASAADVAGIEVIAALSFGLAAWLGAMAYRLRDPRENPIVDLLTRRPHDIAWVYEEQTRGRAGVTVLSAIIMSADGKRADIRLTRQDADVVLAEISRRAPHAARGYSPELEKKYRENPARWRPAGQP